MRAKVRTGSRKTRSRNPAATPSGAQQSVTPEQIYEIIKAFMEHSEERMVRRVALAVRADLLPGDRIPLSAQIAAMPCEPVDGREMTTHDLGCWWWKFEKEGVLQACDQQMRAKMRPDPWKRVRAWLKS